MKVLIGGAWPYANGSLHIGHLAGLLPGDILARYHRSIGNEVHYVSGSDCHGTPVTLRARQENRTPLEISDKYHAEFTSVFARLGFSYDRYGKTSSAEHGDFVREFHRTLYRSRHIRETTARKAYCETCGQFLVDRYVSGACPFCGEAARGDQCDACGNVLEPEQLADPRCALCGSSPVFRESRFLSLVLSGLEEPLRRLLDSHPEWRKVVVSMTRRYLDEGLRDRALTRDLDWGVAVPHPRFAHQKVYIWAENVLGYLSMSQESTRERRTSFEDLWGPDSFHYYVHGKDNVPFHTIILPALLLANTDAGGPGWHLPDSIVASGYLTLEGRKISTSQNWAIWARDILERYQPDAIRYFLVANGPEKRDTDFSWHAFIHSVNSELLGGYGNLAHRTLAFIHRFLGGCVPAGRLAEDWRDRLTALFPAVGACIEEARFKDALDLVFNEVRAANRAFDAQQPWITRETDPEACADTLFSCVQAVANLSVLLRPFLPFSSERLAGELGLKADWHFQDVPSGRKLPEPSPLFDRIPREAEAEEKARLAGLSSHA